MAISDITHTIFGVNQSDKACYFMPQVVTEYCTNITSLVHRFVQHIVKRK